MKTKIIHVLHHSPGQTAYDSGPDGPPPKSSVPGEEKYAIKINKPPFWICFTCNDFHTKLAYETLKKTDEYDIECWRFYRMAELIYEKKINGVLHRLFPAESVSIMGRDFGERSSLLMKALEEEIGKGNVIVHLHGLYEYSHNRTLASIDFRSVPVVTTLRGKGNRAAYIRNQPWKIWYWPMLIWEMMLYKWHDSPIDFFILQSKVEYNYLKKKYIGLNTMFQQDGIDFSLFKPIDKTKARKELGISDELKVLLVVGRYTIEKGVHNAIWAYRRLKQIDSKYRLYLVGGHPEEELYEYAKKSGAVLVTGRRSIPELIRYYSASDLSLTLLPGFHEKNFGGFGNVSIETLACGTPIYSGQLFHFMGSEEEMKKLGIQFDYCDLEASLGHIQYIIENINDFNDTRRIAKKHYNRSENIKNIIKVYDKLKSKYYS